MTLADSEKEEMSRADNHTRELLERTQASAHEQLTRTHGTLRGFRSSIATSGNFMKPDRRTVIATEESARNSAEPMHEDAARARTAAGEER